MTLVISKGGQWVLPTKYVGLCEPRPRKRRVDVSPNGRREMNDKHLPWYALALVAALVGALAFGVPLTTPLVLAIALACPLMMMFMMRGMHGGASQTGTHDPDDHKVER